jgi:putative nucleotidyltransferase with HDIG domain
VPVSDIVASGQGNQQEVQQATQQAGVDKVNTTQGGGTAGGGSQGSGSQGSGSSSRTPASATTTQTGSDKVRGYQDAVSKYTRGHPDPHHAPHPSARKNATQPTPAKKRDPRLDQPKKHTPTQPKHVSPTASAAKSVSLGKPAYGSNSAPHPFTGNLPGSSKPKPGMTLRVTPSGVTVGVGYSGSKSGSKGSPPLVPPAPRPRKPDYVLKPAGKQPGFVPTTGPKRPPDYTPPHTPPHKKKPNEGYKPVGKRKNTTDANPFKRGPKPIHQNFKHDPELERQKHEQEAEEARAAHNKRMARNAANPPLRVVDKPRPVRLPDPYEGRGLSRAQKAQVKRILRAIKNDLSTLNKPGAKFPAGSNFTVRHTVHVALYAKKIAQESGYSGARVRFTVHAAIVHDVGKGIMQSILLKTDPLTDAEYEQLLQKHPEEGVRIAKQIGIDDPELLDAIGRHHKMRDGYGYGTPGRPGDTTELLSVADTFDAKTNPDRHAIYATVMSPQEAIHDMATDRNEKQLNQNYVQALAKAYGLTSVPEIVEETGLARPTIYKYLKKALRPFKPVLPP